MIHNFLVQLPRALQYRGNEACWSKARHPQGHFLSKRERHGSHDKRASVVVETAPESSALGTLAHGHADIGTIAGRGGTTAGRICPAVGRVGPAAGRGGLTARRNDGGAQQHPGTLIASPP